MTSFERGDVVLVLFPNSDLRTAKRRPAIVVQAGNLATDLPQVIIAMITSNLQRAGHPSRVLVRLAEPAARRTGLLTDSVIMTDNLATVLADEIHSTIGKWEDMAPVDRALRHTLGL